MVRVARHLLNIFILLNIIAIMFFSDPLNKSNDSIILAGRVFGLLAMLLILLRLVMIGRVRLLESMWQTYKFTIVRFMIDFSIVFTAISYIILSSFGNTNKLHVVSFNTINASAYILLVSIVFLVFLISKSSIQKKIKYEANIFLNTLLYVLMQLSLLYQLIIIGEANDYFKAYFILLHIIIFWNIIYFRIYNPIKMYKTFKFYIYEIVKEGNECISLYIKGQDIENFSVEPGQFIMVRFLQKGFFWELHPFSISGYDFSHRKWLRLTIKNSGDLTSRINQLNYNANVLIDGPYGFFTEKNSINDKYLFVAQGMGITPIRFLIERLVMKGKDCILFYEAKNENEIIFKKEFDEMTKQHHTKIYYILSEDENWTGEKGHIDKERIVRLVTDLRQRDVYVSTSAVMLEKILRQFQLIGIDKDKIHVEKFEL